MSLFLSLLVGLAQLALSQTPAAPKPEITIAEFVRSLSPEEKQQLLTQVDEELTQKISDASIRNLIIAQIKDVAAQATNGDALDHLPLIPIRSFGALAMVEPPRHGQDRPERARLEISDLEAYLKDCTRARIEPTATKIPRLKYGHFPNLALSDCEHSQSVALAELLSALGENNGSFAKLKDGARFETPSQLIAWLSKDHTITFRDERTLANFLSFTVDDDKNLRWPVWIDTDHRVTRDGAKEPLIVPAGHSQFAWRITGPLLNARVTFFLGIHGAGFFAQVDERPRWTGMRVLTESKDSALVLSTMKAAETYLKINHLERSTIGKGLPADGYGVLGTCNDSVAFLETFVGLPMLTYPLVRQPGQKPEGHTPELEEAYKVLGQLAPDQSLRRGQLKRIEAMDPFAQNPGDHFDPVVAAQMQIVRQRLER